MTFNYNYSTRLLLICLSLILLAGTPATASTTNFSAATPDWTRRQIQTPPRGVLVVSTHPLLTWEKVNNAVFYEVEFLSEAPEAPKGMNPSIYRTFASEHLFTAGYTPDLTDYPGNRFFWRVQAYDLYGNSLSTYSAAQEVRIDRSRVESIKPLSTTCFPGNLAPLYPVYSWIPITGAAQYEVEILKALPENPNGTELSRSGIHAVQTTGFTYYEQQPYLTPGDYYWRVRALDGIGCPIGVFSDAEKFTVNLKNGNYAATFGDSLTHGGGAMSHSPAEPEYNYQTYLDFTAVNLGRSGDTTTALVQRFSRDVLPFRPRHLLILGGINDLRSGTSAQTVINNLILLRDLCISRNIRPIFLTIPPINPANIRTAIQTTTAVDWKRNLHLVNDFLRRQKYCIDISPALSNGWGELPTELSTDGLHPDIAGKQKMAAVINTEWNRVADDR